MSVVEADIGIDFSKKKKKKPSAKKDDGAAEGAGTETDELEELRAEAIQLFDLASKLSSKKRRRPTAAAAPTDLPDDDAVVIDDDIANLMEQLKSAKPKKEVKKKKKTAAADAEVASAASESAAPSVASSDVAPEDAFDLTKKKKKKKVTVAPSDSDETASVAESTATGAESAAPSVSVATGSYWAGSTTTGAGAGAEAAATGDAAAAAGDGEAIVAAKLSQMEKMKQSEDFGEKAWMQSDRDYYYEELLDRVFTLIKAANPESSGSSRRIRIKPPQIAREPKKTIFINFQEICVSLRREPEHVLAYLFSELGTSGNLDGEQRLIIKGLFQVKNIETIIKKYVNEYVGCKNCMSLDTILRRDANTRLYSLNCLTCGASRTVASINKGFVANITPRRRRQ